MMKKLLVLYLCLSSLCYAKENADNSGDNDTAIVGPAGPQGPQGQAGVNGTNGVNGKNGTNGKDGAIIDNSLQVIPILEFDLEHYDSKYLTISSFGNYQLNSDGNNFEVGMRIGLKLGQSYEDKEIEKLKQEIKDAHLSLAQ